MPPVRYHEGGFPPLPEKIDWQRLIPLFLFCRKVKFGIATLWAILGGISWDKSWQKGGLSV